MRISILKSKTEDYRLRGALSLLWECYEDVIFPLPDETTIEEVYSLVCRCFAKSLETTQKEERKVQQRAIEDISKLLHGKKDYWRVETGLLSRRQENDLRYEELVPLYEKLHYKPEEKDIIKFLAKDQEITSRCLSVSSWEELYGICELIIVSRIHEGICNWTMGTFTVRCFLMV